MTGSSHLLRWVLPFALLGAASTATLAQDYILGKLKIDHPWARVTIKDRPAAGYLKVHNMGAERDSIVSASSPVAERVELHMHLMEGGVVKMRPVEKIEVPAKGDAELKPGGHHLMIFGLKQQMKAGDTLPLTLVFEKSGSIKLDLKVEPVGGGEKMKHKGHSGR